MSSNTFADRWLNKRVQFTLMDRSCKGTVLSIIERTDRPTQVVAWFMDQGKYVRASGPWQGFTRV